MPLALSIYGTRKMTDNCQKQIMTASDNLLKTKAPSPSTASHSNRRKQAVEQVKILQIIWSIFHEPFKAAYYLCDLRSPINFTTITLQKNSV